MAELKKVVEFNFFLVMVCLAVVPSVNGYCVDDIQCSPGTCDLTTYRCVCPAGYTGFDCSEMICSPSCLNGGVCHKSLSFSSFHCDCPSGYSGSHCQTRVCSPSCENGGSCYSGICHCATGYSGLYCQHYSSSTPSSVCSPSCSNGGTCYSGVCYCGIGYTGSHCQYSSSSGGTVGIVIGGVFGGGVFIACIVGVTVLRVCLRVSAVRRRSGNARAVRRTPTSAGIGRRVIVIQRVCRAQPTNPNAPPPYVPSDGLQSSDPPPYSADPVNCPLPVFADDTPTPEDQPVPPEVLPNSVNPNDADPPEYLPPPGSDQERQPLMTAEQ